MEGFFSNKSTEGSLKFLKSSCLTGVCLVSGIFSNGKACWVLSVARSWSINSSVSSLIVSNWLFVILFFLNNLKTLIIVNQKYLKLILDASTKKIILKERRAKIVYSWLRNGKIFIIQSYKIWPIKPEFPLSINQKELLEVV